MSKYKRKKLVIKLGGSLVSVADGKLDVEYLHKFVNFIKKLVKEIPSIFIVVGGGRVVRNYQNAAYELGVRRPFDLNIVGMRLTRVNAELIRSAIGNELAGEKIYQGGDFKWTSPIIVGAGWSTGVTSDYNAVLATELVTTKELIRLSNIDYIYSADPKEDEKAIPFKQVTWEELNQINRMSGKMDFSPGMNVPFDPDAVDHAKKIKMTMVFIHGYKLEEVENYLLGKDFIGTFVGPDGMSGPVA